jgi:hypothetical protein
VEVRTLQHTKIHIYFNYQKSKSPTKQWEKEQTMVKVNFLTDTLYRLEIYGKTPEEVEFVTDGYHSVTWDEFKKIANFGYTNDWGSNTINGNLKVVGDGWWLERHVYDGSERWSFKVVPVFPLQSGKLVIYQSEFDDMEQEGEI